MTNACDAYARRRGFRRVAASCTIAGLCVTTSPLPLAPTAQAQTGETSITDNYLWGSNDNRVGIDGPLEISIDTVSPQVVRVSDTVTVTVIVRNISDEVVDNITVRPQRSDALTSAEDARTVLAEPESSYNFVGKFEGPFNLKPKQARQVTLNLPLSAPAPGGLGITNEGVYPLLINVNGRPGEDIDRLLGETRTLLPVQRVAEQDSADGDRNEDGSKPADNQSGNTDQSQGSEDPANKDSAFDNKVPFSLVWPVADAVNILSGETGDAPQRPELILTNDSLADSLRPGGHLDTMLTTLEKAFAAPGGEQLRAATCIAIDPDTLDTVARMSEGYFVGDERPSPVEETTRLRDSWGKDDMAQLRDGSGAEAAERWIARLRELTANSCVMALPWSSADISRIAAVEDTDVSNAALAVGSGRIADILDAEPQRDIYLPPEGYVTDATAGIFTAASALSNTDLSDIFEARHASSRVPISLPALPPERQPTVLVADSTLSTSDGSPVVPGDSGRLHDGTRTVSVSAALSAALAATGTEPITAAYSNVIDRYDYRIDSPTARMQTSVGTLYQELYDADKQAQSEEEGSIRPMVSVPPVDWSANEADISSFLTAISTLLNENALEAMPLPGAVELSAREHDAGEVQPINSGLDPDAVDDELAQRSHSVSLAISDVTTVMANDPALALTRYEFTAPLRRDLIRGATTFNRRSLATDATADSLTTQRVDGADSMVQQVRNSVTLVAPSGVYQRASGLSPAVVVARNGLPLPVPGVVRVTAGNADIVEKHPADLPAKGSVTLQFQPERETAEASKESDSNQHTLLLWLESPNGQRISEPLNIAIQSGAPVSILIVATLVVVGIGGYFAAKRSRRFRK